MEKLIKKTESKVEKWWILSFRFLGLAMLLIAVYLPLKSLLLENTEEIEMTRLRWWMSIIGFFFVWGQTVFGVLANKIGIWLANMLPSGSKTSKNESNNE